MNHMFKTSILLVVALLIATLVSTGSVMAQQLCPPGDCSVTAKRDSFDIAIMPIVENGPFPSEVTGPNYCGSKQEDSPCLLWRYQCIGADCNNISIVWPMIPKCCDKPLKVLWSSSDDPAALLTTCNDNTNPGTICDSYGLRLTPLAGGPGELFWFTTPKDVGTNNYDIVFKVGTEILPCKESIAGPGCNTPVPQVRVEPRRQCYQFIAENQPPTCDEPAQSSTFLAEWTGGDPCAVDVWAAYGDNWTCDNVKIPANKITGEGLDTIEDQNGNTLSDYRTNNSLCDEGWLRFVDPDGCNQRCYVSGGKKYCY